MAHPGCGAAPRQASQRGSQICTLQVCLNSAEENPELAWKLTRAKGLQSILPGYSSGILQLCGSLFGCMCCLSEPPSPCPRAACGRGWLGGSWLLQVPLLGRMGYTRSPLHRLSLEWRLLILDQRFKKLCISFSFGKPFLSLPQLGGQFSPFCNSTKANLGSVFPYLSAKDPVKRGPDK